MALEPVAEGEGFVLHKRDFELLRVGNTAVDSSETRAALAAATTFMKVIPPIAISAEGLAGGIVDLDGYLSRLKPELARMADAQPELRETLEMTARTMSLPRA